MYSNEAKKSILNAVIELISEKPLSKLSVREIARKAEMNSAAINYYFGSKETLFNETMKYYWSSLCQIYERIMAEKNLSPQSVHAYCKEIMYFYFKSSGILRSEQSNFIEQGMDEDTKLRIELQLKAVGQIILSIKPQTQEAELMVKIIRFISSLAHPALFLESFDNIAPKGLTMDKFLDSYITDVIENI
jgi:AcrR family transcriptional regulator